MNKIGLRVIKTAIGSALAIVLAQAIGLRYPYATAIITLLSVQDTRQKSFDVVAQRLKATLLSLTIGSLMFFTFGFNAAAFALYLLLFIPLTVRFNASEGISTSAVLATHLLGEGFISVGLLLNEVMLMVIGTGIAIAMNAYMPKMLGQISEDQKQIEAKFYEITQHLRDKIQGRRRYGINEQQLFATVGTLLETATQRANRNRANYVLIEVSYYAQYMEMRFLQFETLVKLSHILDRVSLTNEQANLLEALTEQFALHLSDAHDIQDLMAETDCLVQQFQDHPLPKTREEFGNQVHIFHYLNEFHHLLDAHQNFVTHLCSQEKILVQALARRESLTFVEKKRRVWKGKVFLKTLKSCYEQQLPLRDPQVQNLIKMWKKIPNNQELLKEIKNGPVRESELGIIVYFKTLLEQDKAKEPTEEINEIINI